jgi:hypothetical protein
MAVRDKLVQVLPQSTSNYLHYSGFLCPIFFDDIQSSTLPILIKEMKMVISDLLDTLAEVCDFADKYYPPRDDRPKRLREMGTALENSTDKSQQRIMLTRIHEFLSGGQGSFDDIGLKLPKGSNLTYAEFSGGYHRKVRKLYGQVKQALENLD